MLNSSVEPNGDDIISHDDVITCHVSKMTEVEMLTSVIKSVTST